MELSHQPELVPNETPNQKIERERLNRRAAFTRIGFTAGAAFLATLTTDDLLRAVGKELSKRQTNNQIVNAVAHELNNAGVASAAMAPCNPIVDDDATPCERNFARKCANYNECKAKYDQCRIDFTDIICTPARKDCEAEASRNYRDFCIANHCSCG